MNTPLSEEEMKYHSMTVKAEFIISQLIKIIRATTGFNVNIDEHKKVSLVLPPDHEPIYRSDDE